MPSKSKKGKGKAKKPAAQASTSSKTKSTKETTEENQEKTPDVDIPLPAIAGLINEGNICFLNSVLQVLRYTPEFVSRIAGLTSEVEVTETDRNDILGLPKVKKDEEGEDDDDQGILVWVLVKQLHELFRKMDSLEDRYLTRKSNVITTEPDALMDTIEQLNPMFEGDLQQDAHELLRCVLAYVQDAVMEINQFRKKHSQPDVEAKDPPVACSEAIMKVEDKMQAATDQPELEAAVENGHMLEKDIKPNEESGHGDQGPSKKRTRKSSSLSPNEPKAKRPRSQPGEIESDGISVPVIKELNPVVVLNRVPMPKTDSDKTHGPEAANKPPGNDIVSLTSPGMSKPRKTLGISRRPVVANTMDCYFKTTPRQLLDLPVDPVVTSAAPTSKSSTKKPKRDFPEEISSEIKKLNMAQNDCSSEKSTSNESPTFIEKRITRSSPKDGGKTQQKVLQGKKKAAIKTDTKDDTCHDVTDEKVKRCMKSTVEEEGLEIEYLSNEPITVNISMEENGGIKKDIKVTHLITDMIETIFQGSMTLKTRCAECENFTERVEAFQDQSIPVKKEKAEDDDDDDDDVVDDKTKGDPAAWVLSAFAEKEVVRGDNKYFCEVCYQLVEAERSLHFVDTPEIFTVQLKRFATTSGSFGSVTKINSHVETPFELPCIRKDTCDMCTHRYELFALISHAGISMSSGHYVSFIRMKSGNRFREEKKKKGKSTKKTQEKTEKTKKLSLKKEEAPKKANKLSLSKANPTSGGDKHKVGENDFVTGEYDCYYEERSDGRFYCTAPGCEASYAQARSWPAHRNVNHKDSKLPDAVLVKRGLLKTSVDESSVCEPSGELGAAVSNVSVEQKTNGSVNMDSVEKEMDGPTSSTDSPCVADPNNNLVDSVSTEGNDSELDWIECDDDFISCLTTSEFKELLAPGGRISPYILFYRRVMDT